MKETLGRVVVLLLLTSNSLARATAGAGIGASALATNRQAQAVATAPQAADVLKPFHGHPFLAAEVTLEGVALGGPAKLLDVAVAEILDARVGVHPGLRKNLLGAGETHAVDVGEGDFHPLVARDVDAGNPSHW